MRAWIESGSETGILSAMWMYFQVRGVIAVEYLFGFRSELRTGNQAVAPCICMPSIANCCARTMLMR